jgi:type II secretory pathway component HofQ
MPQDAYVSDNLVDSIEAIQNLLDIPTFREASQVYDKLARQAQIGDLVEKQQRQDQEPADPDSQMQEEQDPLAAAEEELQRMEEEIDDAMPGLR